MICRGASATLESALLCFPSIAGPLPEDARRAFHAVLECYALGVESRAQCFTDRSLDIVVPAKKYAGDAPAPKDAQGLRPKAGWKFGAWLEVTKPMYACSGVQDTPELKSKFLDSLPTWISGGKVPSDCELLRVGEKYALDDDRIDGDPGFVKMWEPVCPRGCVPAMTPVYAPPRSAVGPYLRPTAPPKGW